MGMCLCITWYYLSFESDATLLWWDDVVAGGCWWREEVMNIMGVWINQRQLASNSLCSKFRQKLNWFLATAAAAAGSMDLFTPTNHIMDFVIDQTGALWTRTLFIFSSPCSTSLPARRQHWWVQAKLEYICDRKPGHTWWTGCKMNFASLSQNLNQMLEKCILLQL